MIDTYLSASDEQTLSAFGAGFLNVIGPASGRAAIAAGTDNAGTIINAIPAAGDPSLWYLAIRSNDAIVPPSNISMCDLLIGSAVLGVWA